MYRPISFLYAITVLNENTYYMLSPKSIGFYWKLKLLLNVAQTAGNSTFLMSINGNWML